MKKERPSIRLLAKRLKELRSRPITRKEIEEFNEIVKKDQPQENTTQGTTIIPIKASV